MASGILRHLGVLFGVEVDKNAEKDAKATLDGIKEYAKKALGAIALTVSVTKVTAIAEEFGAINRMIKSATDGMGDQDAIQAKILQSANLTKSAYADTAKTVSNLVQENSELFGTLDEAINFNNAATMLFKTAGKTNEEIAGLMEAINKSFAKGTVDSETINQLLEKSPEAVKLLNERLGSTSDQLAQMVADGKVSLADLKAAFVDNADAIKKSYEESGMDISDAIRNIRNQWGLYVSQVWAGAGIGTRAAKIIVRGFSDFMRFLEKAKPAIIQFLDGAFNWIERIADFLSRCGSVLGRMIDKVGGVENALKIAAIAAGAIWLALNASKIINFFTTIPGILKKAFSPSGLKTMGLVLLITTVILIVEDFINFMRGNDSVLGTIFDKLGINSDEVRETIVNSWSEIKDTLGVVWGWITDTAGKVSSTLSEFFQSDQGQGLLADAWTALMPVVEAAKKVIVAAIRLIGTIGQFVFSTLQTFWSQFGSTILSAAGSAFSGIMLALEGVLTFIQGVCDLVNAIITGDWSSAWSAFQQILTGAWQACVGIAQAALSTAIAVITAKFGLIWSTIQTYLSNIGSSVAEKMASVSEFIVNGLQKGIDFIKSLPAQALQWGADFIDGLINGIRNAAGKVADAVKGIADKVKSFLHFSRPDTGPLRDYEKWMPDFVGGLSKTLRQAKPKLTVAVSDVAAALKVNPTVQTMQKTVGINKAGNTVNQKVEISNTVTTSDRKSGQKASEMMEKSGEDITDAITKGLQFGRA